MATVLTDARIYAGGADLTGIANAVAVTQAVDLLDTAGAGALARSRVAGPVNAAVDLRGFYDPEEPVDARLAELAGAEVPITVQPATEDDPARAVTLIGLITRWGPSGLASRTGEAAALRVTAEASAALARGPVLHVAENASGPVVRTASGTGDWQPWDGYGASSPPAGGELLAVLHVVQVSGPTAELTVSIESRTGAGPATPRIVFPAKTSADGWPVHAWSLYQGTLEDEWRVDWTFTGPALPAKQARFHVSMGIR